MPQSPCRGGCSGTAPPAPLPRCCSAAFGCALRLWLLPRTAAAAPGDNSASLSDTEGACQPPQDKQAKDIYNCVIKQLCASQAGGSAVSRQGQGRLQCPTSGHPALRPGHLDRDVPQTQCSLQPRLGSAAGSAKPGLHGCSRPTSRGPAPLSLPAGAAAGLDQHPSGPGEGRQRQREQVLRLSLQPRL